LVKEALTLHQQPRRNLASAPQSCLSAAILHQRGDSVPAFFEHQNLPAIVSQHSVARKTDGLDGSGDYGVSPQVACLIRMQVQDRFEHAAARKRALYTQYRSIYSQDDSSSAGSSNYGLSSAITGAREFESKAGCEQQLPQAIENTTQKVGQIVCRIRRSDIFPVLSQWAVQRIRINR
jgi:hypothetical protein